MAMAPFVAETFDDDSIVKGRTATPQPRRYLVPCRVFWPTCRGICSKRVNASFLEFWYVFMCFLRKSLPNPKVLGPVNIPVIASKAPSFDKARAKRIFFVPGELPCNRLSAIEYHSQFTAPNNVAFKTLRVFKTVSSMAWLRNALNVLQAKLLIWYCVWETLQNMDSGKLTQNALKHDNYEYSWYDKIYWVLFFFAIQQVVPLRLQTSHLSLGHPHVLGTQCWSRAKRSATAKDD